MDRIPIFVGKKIFPFKSNNIMGVMHMVSEHGHEKIIYLRKINIKFLRAI
jgi:hypothetical protein